LLTEQLRNRHIPGLPRPRGPATPEPRSPGARPGKPSQEQPEFPTRILRIVTGTAWIDCGRRRGALDPPRHRLTPTILGAVLGDGRGVVTGVLGTGHRRFDLTIGRSGH